MAGTLILKRRQPEKARSKVFRFLIAICIFRMRAEEHEVLFIIAIVSTIKMTIGNKLKAGLPKCSMWQLFIFVSSFASRSILLW